MAFSSPLFANPIPPRGHGRAAPARAAPEINRQAQQALPGTQPAAQPPRATEESTGSLEAVDLHPALWRAHQLARPHDDVLPSGFAVLDAQLPGGGWPMRVLTELLLPHPGLGELRLVAPVLSALQQRQRSVMWFDPPAAPCAWALQALGIDVQQLVVVRPRQPLQGRARQLLPAADILWALEQALKSGHLGAVLAWLPTRLPADALRRLQLAAQLHDGPAFLLREVQPHPRRSVAAGATPASHAGVLIQPSAAPLRLLLSGAGPDLLRVALIKRRGPPLPQPLMLTLPPVLSATALARALALHAPPSSRRRVDAQA